MNWKFKCEWCISFHLIITCSMGSMRRLTQIPTIAATVVVSKQKINTNTVTAEAASAFHHIAKYSRNFKHSEYKLPVRWCVCCYFYFCLELLCKLYFGCHFSPLSLYNCNFCNATIYSSSTWTWEFWPFGVKWMIRVLW